jgi:hypothetical protein
LPLYDNVSTTCNNNNKFRGHVIYFEARKTTEIQAKAKFPVFKIGLDISKN